MKLSEMFRKHPVEITKTDIPGTIRVTLGTKAVTDENIGPIWKRIRQSPFYKSLEKQGLTVVPKGTEVEGDNKHLSLYIGTAVAIGTVATLGFIEYQRHQRRKMKEKQLNQGVVFDGRRKK